MSLLSNHNKKIPQHYKPPKSAREPKSVTLKRWGYYIVFYPNNLQKIKATNSKVLAHHIVWQMAQAKVIAKYLPESEYLELLEVNKKLLKSLNSPEKK